MAAVLMAMKEAFALGDFLNGFGDIADGANVFFTMEVGNNDGTLVSSRRNREWIGTSDLRLGSRSPSRFSDGQANEENCPDVLYERLAP